MKTGVSTACFYPLETEKALVRVGEIGVKTAEIFFNAPSELESPLIDRICEIKDKYSINIKSIHPYLSFGETYLFFCEYKRRYYDTLKIFRKHFEVAKKLNSKFLVIHGSLLPGIISKEEYFKRFKNLVELGKEYDVVVAQENVVKFFSESPDFLLSMQDALKDDFHMVLDLKQAARANRSAFEFVDRLGESIVHIHVSDLNDKFDCLPPGEGVFDFNRLISKVKNMNGDVDLIIELYKKSFETDSQIIKSVDYLNSIISKH